MHYCMLLYYSKITLKDSNVEINVLDDAFVKICDLVCVSQLTV